MAKAEGETENEAVPPVTPSELDELTHAEMLMLYGESSDAVRFAKRQQWATTVGTLAIFVVLGFIGFGAYRTSLLFKLCVGVSLVLSVGAIYSVIIYQFWQNAEREKMFVIIERLSSVAKSIRDHVPERERNVHRYVLLFFMFCTIITGNATLIVFLTARY